MANYKGRGRKPKLSAPVVVNAAQGQVIDFFTRMGPDRKHHTYYDFGYPDVIEFDDYYRMFKRNGFASAGVRHAVDKTWRDYPWLLEKTTEPHDETQREREFREAADRLDWWGNLKDADLKSRVGHYAGVILRYADGLLPSMPVVDGSVRGLDKLVDIIPVYEQQLIPMEFDTDPTSLTYGKPTMYQFNEAAVGAKTADKCRQFQVHPDRVLIWSKDGSIHGDPVLEPGFNHLIDIEKITGSGGEGFWKNAKSAPVLEVKPEANLAQLAQMLGVAVEDMADRLDEVVAGWQKGFDQLLMLQGIEAKTLGVTLPQPSEFLAGPLQGFAASINEPLKILVGSQTGERASTEDAREWDSFIMSRRENYVKPNIMRLVRKLVRAGVMADIEWVIFWSDLTEDSMDEKIARADKMAGINQKMLGTGERAYTADEIRDVTGHLPLNDNDILPEDKQNEEE